VPERAAQIRGAALYARGMSKLDAQRALKASRYEAARAASSARAASTATKATTSTAATTGPTPDVGDRTTDAGTKPARKAPAPASDATGAPDAPAALCGHRGSSGKHCTRPAGHAETSHRYK
jgi:hypothetical protein